MLDLLTVGCVEVQKGTRRILQKTRQTEFEGLKQKATN